MPRVTPAVLVSALALTLAGCGATAQGGSDGPGAVSGAAPSPAAPATITVAANNGTVEVPTRPQRVVALDNSSFETLEAFGITPVAAPKQLLPENLGEWARNGDILDVGTHREPKLEVVAQARPDLIIGGKRFAKVTPDLQKLAPVLDLAPSTEKDGYVDALKKQTQTLGEIFGKEAEATQLITALDRSVEAAAKESSGQRAFLANHNGGRLDNGAGRIGVLLQPLKVTDVFETKADNASVHQDSGLAPETVAQKNPDVLIVMDRDAAVSSTRDTATPASQTVAAQKAWAGTTFMKNDAIVYLADNFYVTEGIQAYTDAYTKIADVLGKSTGTSS